VVKQFLHGGDGKAQWVGGLVLAPLGVLVWVCRL